MDEVYKPKSFIRVIRENPWPPLPFQEELSQLHIRRSRNLDIPWRAHHHGHLIPERSTSEASSVPKKPSAVASSNAFFSTL